MERPGAVGPEPLIPKSMHDGAIEAAQTFARQEVEREALRLIAWIIEAAGGEIRLSRNVLSGEPPDLFRSEDFRTNQMVYWTKRRPDVD